METKDNNITITINGSGSSTGYFTLKKNIECRTFNVNNITVNVCGECLTSRVVRTACVPAALRAVRVSVPESWGSART